MARGSNSDSGKRMKFFDVKPVLPKLGEPTNVEGMCVFALKTRVKVDDAGTIIRKKDGKTIPQFIKGRPVMNPTTKKTVMIHPPEIALDSDVWDYVAPETSLSGYLVAVDFSEYTTQGDVVKTFSLLLKDPTAEEIYKISFSFNKVTYRFLNSLFNLEFGSPDEPVVHWLKLRLGKYTGTDGNEYVSLFLYRAPNDKEKNDPVAWKYSLNKDTKEWVSEDGDIMPPVEKISTKGGKVVSDDSVLQAWCLDKLETISQTLTQLKINDSGEVVSGKVMSNPSMQEEGEPEEITEETDPAIPEDAQSTDDDLPF